METKIMYGGYEQRLWDFAQIEITLNNVLTSMSASFTEQEKKRNVQKMMETLIDIEGELLSQTMKGLFKENMYKFMRLKTFGTIEQMRIEMELRFKAS